MKSRSTACLWALFLGNVGAHHFYLGNKRAFLYLMLCLTFIPAFVAFLEILTWLLNDEKIFDQQYNKTIVQNDNLDQLDKLFALKQKGAITEEEFQEKKKDLVS